MTLAAQIVTSGVVTGLIYMLIALGVSCCSVRHHARGHFVHGELVMLSAFAVYFLGSEEAGLPFWLALLAAIWLLPLSR
jgi:branched-subunit amino acid ABC-type transport system permease component